MSVLRASTDLVGPIRASIDRVIPRGALVLTVLSLGYFAIGIVRNRVFANTYGAGAELDAYNAAFRIPEIALDVLVAAGLTAPFVPIFSSLRHDTGDDGVANEFGRTVLTGAVAVMAVASVLIFLAAPWLADRIGSGFDPATRELTVEMMRINCVAQVMFAASIALGEVLVANRRFVFYALAPILYTTGIVVATVLFAGRYGIIATAWGAVAGAVAHLGIRAIGTLRTSFRIRPGFAIRTAAFAEFLRLMVPRMVSLPIDPITAAWFTVLATGLGVGSVSAYTFASDYQVLPVSLIGVSFSLAIFPTLSAAFAAGDGRSFRAELGRNLVDHRDPDRPRGGGAVRAVRHARPGAARWRASSARTTSRGHRPSWPPSHCRCRSMPSPTRCRAGCTRRTTRSARSWPRSPGWAQSSSPRAPWCRRSGSWPSRSATRPG